MAPPSIKGPSGGCIASDWHTAAALKLGLKRSFTFMS
jgi:hypothetical protein